MNLSLYLCINESSRACKSVLATVHRIFVYHIPMPWIVTISLLIINLMCTCNSFGQLDESVAELKSILLYWLDVARRGILTVRHYSILTGLLI